MNKTVIATVIALAVGIGGGFVLSGILNSGGSMQAADSGKKKVLYWVAPMDPKFRRDQPGKSPMGMDLVPVYEGEENGASGQPALTINPAVVQNLGVRTAKAESGDFSRTVETVGYIMPNDNLQSEVTVRTEGWIEELAVKTPGEQVEKGDLLFRMYAPDLANAQAEYLQAAKRGNAAIRDAAKQRLKALGMTDRQIGAMAKEGSVEALTEVRAPQSGTLLDLSVTEGAYVKPGTVIARLADLSSVWVMAEVFEDQVPWVKKGADATMRLAFAPAETWEGRIDYVYPTIDPNSRTVKVRLAFDNPQETLKPNMYADLTIDGETRQNVVSIPREALIRTGTSDRVILALGDGQFRPAEVVPGMESGDRVAIIKGLKAGETIVTSAQFLIDSEASLDASLLRLTADHENPSTDIKNIERPAKGRQPAAETGMVSGTGRVTAVKPDENQITLAHEAIPQIGWPAMTMGFAVKSGTADNLQPGDQVDFTLMKMPNGNYMITDIRKVDAASAPDEEHSE